MRTEYTSLTNMEVPDCYKCTDKGVYLLKEGGKKQILVCEAISLVGLYEDIYNGSQYTVFEYFDIHTKKIKKTSVASLDVKKGNFDGLLKGSFEVASVELFKEFIRAVKILNKQKYIDGSDAFEIGTAATKYGFPKINAKYDYTNFVGVTSEILSTEQDRETDESLFVEEGTFNGWKKDIQEIVKDAAANGESIYRIALSSGLAGITLAFLPEYYYPPVVSFSGPTSIGKGLILGSIYSMFGHPTASGGIKTVSDSSVAGLYALKGRLNQLPLCIEDIQDLFHDRDKGIEYISQMIFNHSKGTGSLRANIDGKKRDTITFRNVMIMFAETSDLDKLTGGAKARVVNFKIDRNDGERITKNPSDSYTIDKNYGFAAKVFIERMMEYNKRCDVLKEFKLEVGKYVDRGVNVKQAATFALISYTFNLARKFNIFDFWQEMTVDECIAQYDFEQESISADTKLYNAVCAYIIRHNNVYPFTEEKIDRGRYELHLGTAEEIRGRLDKKNNCCWIPTDTFNQVMEQCIKTNAITGISPDIKILAPKWVKNGYLERYDDKKIQWTKTNITSPAAEKVYKLIMPPDSLKDLSVERNVIEYDSFGQRVIK